MKECFVHTHYGWCYYDLQDMLIYGLYVNPAVRRQGKATRLLKMAIAEMRAAGQNGPIKVEAIPQGGKITKSQLTDFYKRLGLVVINEQSKTKPLKAQIIKQTLASAT